MQMLNEGYANTHVAVLYASTAYQPTSQERVEGYVGYPPIALSRVGLLVTPLRSQLVLNVCRAQQPTPLTNHRLPTDHTLHVLLQACYFHVNMNERQSVEWYEQKSKKGT